MMRDLLLVIDMQEGFRSHASESIVQNIKKLIQHFRGEVIFFCFRNEHNSMFQKVLKWGKFQNKEDQKVLAEFDENQRKIFHSKYTILDKKLINFMKRNRFRKIYLSGVYTDVCIMKAAMDAFDHKIGVKVVYDACNSLHGKNNHEFAIDSLRHIIGKDNVISVKDVIS